MFPEVVDRGVIFYLAGERVSEKLAPHLQKVVILTYLWLSTVLSLIFLSQIKLS